MDLSSIFTFVGGLTYISFTIYRANQEQISNSHTNVLRWLQYGVALLTFLYGLFILQTAFIEVPANVGFPQIDPTSAVINFVLTTALCLFSTQIIASAKLRERIRRILPASATYNPDSPVHTTACVLILAVVCVLIGDFVVGGGIAGLAQNIQASGGVGFGDLLFEDVLWVLAAAVRWRSLDPR